MMSKPKAFVIAFAVTVIFAAFFLYPASSIVVDAFRTEDGGFTLELVREVFRNPVHVEGVLNALYMGAASTLLALLIAFPLSLVHHRFVFPGRRLFSGLILVPLVLPPFVGAIGLAHILGVAGSLNAFLIEMGWMNPMKRIDWLAEGRFWGVVAMNALHLYPILYLNITASLAQIDPAVEQAAENLGSSPRSRLFRVTLPLAMPGIFAGGSLVFIWSFTELGVPLVFGYDRVAPVQIFHGLKDLNGDPTPYALVSVVLLISLLVFGITKMLFGRNMSFTQPRPKASHKLRPLGKLASLACMGIFLVVFLLASIPHAGVLLMAFSGDWYDSILPLVWTLDHFKEALGDPLVVPSIENSLVYASCATVVALCLGLAASWVIARSDLRGRGVLDALLMLPLAVPGLVLAFGYLALSREGQPLHFMMWPAGSPAVLLIAAYAVRRLPYVVRSAVAGLQQGDPAMEEAARTFGAGSLKTLRRVSLPLIATNIVAGGILAFSFSMLEVSDSLILAQRVEHYPITKAIYTLLSTLGNGHQLAAALGVWAMVFLGVSMMGAVFIAGKKGGLFRM